MSSSNTFDPEEIERQLAVKLSMTALQGEGSVPAARQVLDLLDRIWTRHVAEAHGRHMEEIAERPIELARYLGYLGESIRSMKGYLGHEITAEERAAFDEGRQRRHLELRAVELDRAVRGHGKPAPWMRT